MEWIKEYKFYLLAAIAAAIFYSFSFTNSGSEEEMEEVTWTNEERGDQEPETKPKAEIMMAEIKGAVNRPGVYTIEKENRVNDLIELAGGLTKDADAGTVNFAMRVNDEMSIYIPRKGESQEDPMDIQNVSQQEKKTTINLNKATASELETLPGIGPAKAAAILEYRESNGSFQTIEDLKDITGIGEKTFEKLKDLISVN